MVPRIWRISFSWLALPAAILCAHCGGGDSGAAAPNPHDAAAEAPRHDAAPPPDEGGVDATRDAASDGGHHTASRRNRSVCGVKSGELAWTASVAVSASTLVLSDVAASLTDDVVVADQSGASYEQHRWDDTGSFVTVHQDPLGAYEGTLWASSIILDTHDNLFYGMLKTGLVEGENSGAELSFTLLPPVGAPVVSPPITNAMPTADGPPRVLLFSTGFDSGGGYHGPLSMAAPSYFPAGVYCYGSSITGEATSAQSATAMLTTGDFEWPSESGSLYVIKAVTSSIDFGCGNVTVPAGGGVILASLDAGGGCQWNELLALPTAAVKAKNFRVGADGTLALAVVYSGSIDFGGGSLKADGPTSLAVARFDGTGHLLFAKSFGSSTSHFSIGSVGVNATGTLFVTSGYRGMVDLGGGALAATDDTVLAVFDVTGAFKWNRTVTVGGSGKLLAAIGACGMAIATNSPSVDLGGGPLSSASPGKSASIGVAALGL
jgi:hypothetical protein